LEHGLQIPGKSEKLEITSERIDKQKKETEQCKTKNETKASLEGMK
jgi:hypothetical protein